MAFIPISVVVSPLPVGGCVPVVGSLSSPHAAKPRAIDANVSDTQINLNVLLIIAIICAFQSPKKTVLIKNRKV